MTQLTGVMVGARCAVLSIYTTDRSTNDDFVVYYKKASESSYTSVNGNYAGSGTRNLYFVDSEWAFDVYNLEPQTSYEIYVKVRGNESNHINFTTEAEGVFRYNLVINDGVTEAASASSVNMMSNFAQRMIDIGYNINKHSTSYSPKFIACKAGDIRQRYNAVAVAHGIDTSIEFDSPFTSNDTFMSTFIHEYRHLMFFTPANSSICYASDMSGVSDKNQLYKTFSFFSRNNNKSEAYTFYGENSCSDTQYLYDFFILKAISNNTITIYK